MGPQVFLLFFLNGLAFFASGLALALENRRASLILPSTVLNLLAAYAITGSVANFLQMGMSLGGVLLPEAWLLNLSVVKLFLIGLGPAFLLLFGTNMMLAATRDARVRYIAISILPAWLLLILLGVPLSSGVSLDWVLSSETLTRRVLYFPALLVSALGMLLLSRMFRRAGLAHIASAGLWASAAFGLKAVLSGAIGLPAPAASTEAVAWAYGVLVQGGRTFATVGVAWSVINLVRALDRERRRQLDVAIEGHLQAQKEAREAVERWGRGLGHVMDAVSSAISSPMSLAEIASIALREVLALTHFEAGEVFFSGEDGKALTFVTQMGMPEAVEGCPRAVEAGQGAIEGIANEADVVVVANVQEDPVLAGKPCWQAGFRVIVRVPLKHRGNVLGTMNLFSRSERAPEADEISVLAAVGQQIGVAIENARLYSKVQHLAVLEERSRLSRELHDGLAQVLGYLHLQGRVLEQRLAAGEVTGAQAVAAEMRETAGRAYDDVREAILGLRSTLTPGVGLVPAVKEYLRRFGEQSGLTVNLMVSEHARVAFAPTVEVQLLRIIQEALTNARKHSGARRVWVRFERDAHSDLIIVEDDGRGFDPAEATRGAGLHFGLQTMVERAQSVGGVLRIQSEPGAGTLVIVELPRED